MAQIQKLPNRKKLKRKLYEIIIISSSKDKGIFIRNISIKAVIIIFILSIFLLAILSSFSFYQFSESIKKSFMLHSDAEESASLLNAKKLDSLAYKLELLGNYKDRIESLFSGSGDVSLASNNPKKNFLTPAIQVNKFVIKPKKSLHFSTNKDKRMETLYMIQGTLTREFNPSKSHYGLDVATSYLQSIRAYEKGTVLFAGWSHEFGHTIIIGHGLYTTFYKHCSSILVEQGEFINQGDIIGLAGNTGSESKNPHLHFEIWKDGIPQDPKHYIAIKE